jgi:ribosomal peptide maturation radical SAM protein 1
MHEMVALANKHHILDFNMVDNILDMTYLKTVLPAIRDSGTQFRFYFETKANLARDQVELLCDAGVDRIQPGIESLSTPILKLMNKGTTAIQNIQLLKWCAEYNIHVDWNILVGFPGEDAEAYTRMADIVPRLSHLSPPSRVLPVRIDRFSPYYVNSDVHGIVLRGPMKFYQFLYDTDPASLSELAYFFERADSVGIPEYAAALHERVLEWASRHNSPRRPALTFRRGPGFLVVMDKRDPRAEQEYVLDDAEGAIYLAIDAATTARGVQTRLPSAIRDEYSEDEISQFLDELVDQGLAFQEGNRYVSLAIPEFKRQRSQALEARGPRRSDALQTVHLQVVQ